MALVRLDKLVSQIMDVSRKDATAIIKSGAVKLNDAVVKNSAEKCEENADLKIHDKSVKHQRFIYVMLHKPQGVLSAARDKNAETILDLLPKEFLRREVFPAGRLDKDVTGLIILSNDGTLVHELISPSKRVKKVYEATLDSPVTHDDVKLFAKGLYIDEELTCLPAELVAKEGTNDCVLTICEGKFHQVKRMFLAVSKTVLKLKRVSFGAVVLDENLLEGQWRYLSDEEIKLLKEPSKA